MNLACMLCGAAGSHELYLSILTIFLLMFGGTGVILLASILNGDFREGDAVRARPLDAEREGGLMGMGTVVEPANDGTGLERVEKSEMRYGAEPRFPWPLAVAWGLFVVWGVYYVMTRLVPAYAEWTPR